MEQAKGKNKSETMWVWMSLGHPISECLKTKEINTNNHGCEILKVA